MRSSSDLHTEGGKEFTELVMGILRTNGRLLKAGDEITKEFEITSARWQIFGAIDEQPRTVAQIARIYEHSRQGILWTVKSMCDQGLLELVENPDHRRAKLVDFSEKGRKMFDELTKKQAAWANSLAEEYTIEELKTTNDIIGRMGEALSQHYHNS